MHWCPLCFEVKKISIGCLLWCMFGACVTGAKCALTLSVGLNSLLAQCSLRRCASLFSVGLYFLYALCSVRQCASLFFVGLNSLFTQCSLRKWVLSPVCVLAGASLCVLRTNALCLSVHCALAPVCVGVIQMCLEVYARQSLSFFLSALQRSIFLLYVLN